MTVLGILRCDPKKQYIYISDYIRIYIYINMFSMCTYVYFESISVCFRSALDILWICFRYGLVFFGYVVYFECIFNVF